MLFVHKIPSAAIDAASELAKWVVIKGTIEEIAIRELTLPSFLH